MEEITVIEGVVDVQRMWALGNRLLLSTSTNNAIITLDPVEEVQVCSQLAESRILAACMIGDLLVTVRENGVEIWSDVVKGNKIATWPATGVVTAAIYGENVVVGTGSEVAVLSVSKDITHAG
jgi:DNA damage-binding protein 1